MRLLSRMRRSRTQSSADPQGSPAAARKLLARAAAGDERALERVYETHVDSLYAFVFYRVGRDPALAEDVVQETFAAALDRMGAFEPERGSLQSWLCSLSRNVIRDHLRAHRRSDELAAMWERIDQSLAQIFESLDRAPLSDEVIARAETRDMVNMTIANLPERYREILRRKYIQGQSLDAMSSELRMSREAAKSLLARARRAFRETFSTLSQQMAEVDV
jgi:RNA polymerase sigma-70 factor (ECF subfamily)